MVTRCQFILYVTDQEASRRFYESVLAQAPILDVPGMTEFAVCESVTIGLMPERGIRRLLNLNADGVTDPSQIRGELYLIGEKPEAYHERALLAGAKELSPMSPRDWGDSVAYSLDPDGYVLAFARSGRDL